MERIQVKILNNRLVVRFNAHCDFDSQWNQWIEKLQQLNLHSKERLEVFFHFPNLDDEVIHHCLKQMLSECMVLGFQKKQLDTKEKDLEIIHSKVRGGDPLVFENGGLVCGDIEKDVFVTLESGNLYVTGCIKGKVECLEPNSVIYCASMDHAMICFNNIWQNSTFLVSPVTYDESVHQQVKEKRLWQEVY